MDAGKKIAEDIPEEVIRKSTRRSSGYIWEREASHAAENG